MKKQAWVSLAFLIITVILSIVSYLLLPENVVTQITAGGSGVTTTPKLLAVIMPFALGAGGAISGLIIKNDDKARTKSLIVSIAGIAIFAIMLIVNLRFF